MQGILIWTILLRLLYWPCQAWWEKQMDGGVVLWIKTASVSRISSRMSGDMFFLQYMKVSVLQLTFNHPSGCQSFSLSTVSWWVMAPGHLVKPVLKNSLPSSTSARRWWMHKQLQISLCRLYLLLKLRGINRNMDQYLWCVTEHTAEVAVTRPPWVRPLKSKCSGQTMIVILRI